jgi:ATP-binding cassette subfamily B multidrug efflux pump
MDLPLALAAASPLLIGVPLSALMMRRLHARYKDSQDSHGVLTGRVQEDISGVRALKTYAREEASLGNFDRVNSDYTAKAVCVSFYDALFEPYFRFVPQIGFVAVLAWGGWKLYQDEILVGDLVAFLAYVGLMIWPIFAGGLGFNMLQRARASAKRLEEILSVAPERRPPEQSGPDRFSGELAFRGLTFRHEGQDAATIRDLSLDLPAGTVLGITGPTGSGKSTLLYVAAGLLPAPNGAVLLDGADISEIGRGKLRRAVTLVEQTPFLFSRSLEDNLAYGREDAGPERVREAVRLASLDADVERFDKGLATMVGERGVTLSGGQRLRAALARALVIEPRVLLLDDVFSAVDVETEKAIWSRIRPKLAWTTVVVVSHRISVLRECDRIAVIHDGGLSEYGTHEELLRGDGFYARTFALQEQFES